MRMVLLKIWDTKIFNDAILVKIGAIWSCFDHNPVSTFHDSELFCQIMETTNAVFWSIQYTHISTNDHVHGEKKWKMLMNHSMPMKRINMTQVVGILVSTLALNPSCRSTPISSRDLLRLDPRITLPPAYSNSWNTLHIKTLLSWVW